MNSIKAMSIVRNKDGTETGRIFLDQEDNEIHMKKFQNGEDEYYFKKIEFYEHSNIDRANIGSLKMVKKELKDFDIYRMIDSHSEVLEIHEVREIIPYNSSKDKKMKYMFENEATPKYTNISFRYIEDREEYIFDELEESLSKGLPFYFGQIIESYKHMKESDKNVETIEFFESFISK